MPPRETDVLRTRLRNLVDTFVTQTAGPRETCRLEPANVQANWSAAPLPSKALGTGA